MHIALSHQTVRGKLQWVVTWWPDCGKRERQFFHSKAKADAHVSALRLEEKQLGSELHGLSREDRQVLAGLLARARIRGYSLQQAADFFERHSTNKPPLSLGAAYQAFMGEKDRMRLSKRSRAALRSNIGRFVRAQSERPLDGIRREDLQLWLQQWQATPRTFNTYATSLKSFFHWCARQEYIAKDPTTLIARISERQMPDLDEPPAILSLTQCQALLAATQRTDARLIPYVAVCLFAGLRPEREAGKLAWEDVQGEEIVVRGLHAKDRQRRHVTVHPTLRAWLDLGGDLPPTNLRRRFEAVRAEAGLIRLEKIAGHARRQVVATGWAQDCLRHTFASNSLPMFGAEATRLQLGHGDFDMLFRHYRALVSRANAEAFWALTPNSLTRLQAAVAQVTVPMTGPKDAGG